MPYCIKAKKMYEHNALGYWSGLSLCLTKVRSSRARCPLSCLIVYSAPKFKNIILNRNIYFEIIAYFNLFA